eukprot:g3257.t1
MPEHSELCNLSVQLFTIPEVASDLLKEKILESVLTAVQRLQNQLLDVKDGVTQAKGLGECGEMWNHWFRMLHDLGYLFYHASVCQYFLATQAVQEMVVELMVPLWRLCAQKREERVDRLGDLLHLQFLDVSENLLGPSPGAALQMIGNCCKLTVICVAGNPFVDDTCDYRYQLIDLCPSLRMVDGEETPEASFQELRPWYSCLIAGLKRCSNFQSTFNCAAFSSFHLPLLRLLSSCMHWELLQNAEQPGDWRELFPSDFLVHTMTHLVRTLRFEDWRWTQNDGFSRAEIQNGLWVRNGQSMHKQQSDYRQNLRQWDILAFQACMLLMDLYEEAEPLACLWTGLGESWVKVAVQLRFRLFWTVLAQALNEMMPIEVSLCRRRWESRYARCSVILQRFFIQILAKPMSVAELTPLIPKEWRAAPAMHHPAAVWRMFPSPKELQAREPQVTEVLDLVALRKDQKFQLKAKSWAYFDCLMAEAFPMRRTRESWEKGGASRDPQMLKTALWGVLAVLVGSSCPKPGKVDFRACQTDVTLGGTVAPLPSQPADAALCASNQGCANLGLPGNCCPASGGQYLSCCDSSRRLAEPDT